MQKLLRPGAIVSFLLFAILSALGQQQKPIDPANFDTSVRPSVDFFKYANGGWMKNNSIPADQSIWGSFSELQEHNYAVLHEILDEAMKRTDAQAGSPWQMVGDFYASGMDSAAVDQNELKPLAGEFGKIASINNTRDLARAIAHFQSIGIGVPFAFRAGQDDKKSTDIIAQISQSGLGLPDRDYYTKTDGPSVKIRDQYREHIEKMFALLGDARKKAEADAAAVMNIESSLARASMTRLERRDPNATYHKMSVQELQKLVPVISWKEFFSDLGNGDIENVDVGMPRFMTYVDTLITTEPLDAWKVYLRWHLIHATASYLSSKFVDENFHFSGQILSGTQEIAPRWKRVLESTNRSIGEALGQLYVERAFSPAAKARAVEMVANLKAALHDRIARLEWMSDATKKAAFKKLEAFGVKIGYPDKWRDYSNLKISRQPYVLNVLAAREFEFNRNLQKIGKPVDKTEWRMTPPTVNASYSSNMNDITFPAGILQPPFFDPNADDAVNYGGMGAVIGHEMTHGFDDQGRKYDADGNLTDWWTADDAKNFLARSTKIEDQFSAYVVLDSVHVNGKTTIGENIADLGGLKIAYDAFEKSLEGKPRPPLIDGLTPEQRFFLAWAQIWRANIRPQALRLRIATDPHSPGEFRTNGPLSNLQEFQKAFEVKDGDPMARPLDQRVRIW